jgi:hypothetical protein
VLLIKELAIFEKNNCNSNAAKLAQQSFTCGGYSATGFNFVK